MFALKKIYPHRHWWQQKPAAQKDEGDDDEFTQCHHPISGPLAAHLWRRLQWSRMSFRNGGFAHA